MEPRWLPKPLGGRLGGFLELPQKSSKKCFENCRFWGSLGDPLGRLLGNILEGISRLFVDLVLGGVLEAFWEGFGVDFGRILGGFWGRFWQDFGIIFGLCFHMFCMYFLDFSLSTHAASLGNLECFFLGWGQGAQANVEQVLGRARAWADAGQSLGRCWADPGHMLSRCLAGLGQMLGRSWADAGQTLNRCWAELAHLGLILGSFLGDLVRYWPNVFHLGALPVPC